MDYEQAIVEYTLALEIEPNKEALGRGVCADWQGESSGKDGRNESYTGTESSRRGGGGRK